VKNADLQDCDPLIHRCGAPLVGARENALHLGVATRTGAQEIISNDKDFDGLTPSLKTQDLLRRVIYVFVCSLSTQRINKAVMDRLSMFMAVTVKLQNPKFHGLLLISIIVIGISLSPLIFSSLTNSLTIPSSGTIETVSISGPQYLSQYRIMFFQVSSSGYVNNWTLVADTCAANGINTVIIEVAGASDISTLLPWTDPRHVTEAAEAFHAVGIKVFADFDTMITNVTYEGVDTNAWYGNATSYGPVPDGGWLDIANPTAMSLLQAEVTSICTNMPIDGWCTDYNYWVYQNMPYDPAAETAFESWMQTNYNITVTSFPAQVVSGAVYFNYFQIWRNYEIDLLQADMAQWVHAVNSSTVMVATAFDIYIGNKNEPSYWYTWEGQDAGYWISNNLVQMIMPMEYGDYNYSQDTLCEVQYWLGVAHGECALVPFITDMPNIGAGNWTGMPVGDFANVANSVVQGGSDGWAIWSYNGPGEGGSDPYVNSVPYLQNLNLTTSAFTMGNVIASNLSSTSEQITYQTNALENTTVEYSSSPLFTSTFTSEPGGSSCTVVIYDAGTIVSNSTTTTSHSTTLTGLTTGTKYYFRVQSQDSSGTATSEVSTFTAG
jgi:hypothetical protein